MAHKIMIVDDSEFMQIMLQDILKKPEFEVVGVARNGIEAIEKYMALKPDLVTLDICMPHLNGLEVLDRICEFDRTAKIVIVSSKGRTGDVEAEAISKGAKGVITKPFKPSQTLNTIREILALAR